jgi:hypothetical protein
MQEETIKATAALEEADASMFATPSFPLQTVPTVRPPSPPPAPSQYPRPPPQHYSDIMSDLHDTLGIGDVDPEYDEVVKGGHYSSCANLSGDNEGDDGDDEGDDGDDDGDNGDEEYSRGGGLDNILRPPNMQHPARCGLPRKHKRQEQAGQERVQGDDGNDEDFDREGRDDEDYSGLWEGGGFEIEFGARLKEGTSFQNNARIGLRMARIPGQERATVASRIVARAVLARVASSMLVGSGLGDTQDLGRRRGLRGRLG